MAVSLTNNTLTKEAGTMNKVMNKYTARINNNVRGLAGCNNTSCKLDCLRKDKKLAYRVTFLNDGIANGCFIAK